MKTFHLVYAHSVLILLVSMAACVNSRSVEANGRVTVPQGSAKQQPRASQPKWQAPTYKGLILGKSKRGEVLRIFGKPIWSGPPEEKLFDDDREPEVLYEYQNAAGVEGITTIVLGKRTGIVKAVELHINRLPLEEALERYGRDYVEHGSELGPCPTKEELKEYQPPENKEYPVFFVYPRQGMYLYVDHDQMVTGIFYTYRCP